MSAKPWYAWFPADYRAKTAHLTYLEDAAYRRLLDAYYERQGPLPADRPALYRIAGAQEAGERKALDCVVDQFFQNGNGLLRHQRCEEQIEKEKALREGYRERGSMGGKARAEGIAKLQAKLQAKAQHSSSTPDSDSDSDLYPDSSHRGFGRLSKDKHTPASPDTSGSAVALIPLVGNREFAVTAQFLAELETAYPAVDGAATLREIRAWCLSNPSKRKTERGARRFINAWFERTQNA